MKAVKRMKELVRCVLKLKPRLETDLAVLQFSAYKLADVGVYNKGGREAFESLPEWCQELNLKLVGTLFRPFVDGIEKVFTDKSAYAHGKFDGLLLRIRHCWHAEILEGKGVFMAELIAETEGADKILAMLEELSGTTVNNEILHELKNHEEIDANDSRSLEEIGGQNVSGYLSFLDGLYVRSHTKAAQGRYTAEELKRYHEGVQDGFNGWLNSDGWFTQDRGRARVYLALLTFREDIEALRVNKNPATVKVLLEKLDEWNGSPVECDEKRLSAICLEIGLKFHEAHRPRKTTNQKNS